MWIKYFPKKGLLPPDLAKQVLRYPGVAVRGNIINAPDNAAWLVEQELTSYGFDFDNAISTPDLPSISDVSELVERGLREWVPGFMTPYQKEGVVNMSGRSGMFFWAPGSGKTLGAIAWSLCIDGKVVVTTRAPVRRNFAREIERFTTHRAYVVEGIKPIDFTALPTDYKYLVFGHEILPDHVDNILKWGPSSFVLDESQRVKSQKRFEATPNEDGSLSFSPRENVAYAAYRISRGTRRRLMLTGSPIKDRVRDLWAQLDLAQPDCWGPFYRAGKPSFAARYCAARPGAYGGIDTTGSSNLEELWDRVSLGIHQVAYSTTHRDLPPKRRIVTFVPPHEQDTTRGFEKIFEAADKKGKTNAVEARLMEAAARKRSYLMGLLEEAIENNQKVVVFTGRREDCERLAREAVKKFGKKADIISAHGGHPAAYRDELQQKYMAAPAPIVLIGTGDAWGECLDPDTMILGANKPLRDCIDGDEVFGKSGISTSESATIHPYTGQMVEIRAQGLLPMRSTTGHATLIIAGGMTKGSDRHFEFKGEPGWKNSEAVRPWDPCPKSPINASGDYLLVPRLPGKFTDFRFDLNQYVLDHHGRDAKGCPQELVLDNDLAWVLGLYVAEGSSTIQADGHIRVSFSLSAKETDLAERVKEIMEPRGFKVAIRQQKTWMHVVIRSIPLGRILRDLCGVGSDNKKIPNEILLNTDLGLLRSFLDGYVAGDGTEYEGGRKVQISTVSKVLALNIQLAIARFGRLASIIPWKPDGGEIEGRKINSNQAYRVTWCWESKRHDRFKVLDKYIATPVKSVEVTDYSGPVGYMSTNDKTMLASNAVVHNGVNLHDSDLFIISMLPYTPGQIIQWEGRVARQGQKRPVMIQYLIAEGTVDEHVASLMTDKLPAVETVARDESIAGLSDSLLGFDNEEALLDSILGKLGDVVVTEDDD
jgi:hypothetical protein